MYYWQDYLQDYWQVVWCIAAVYLLYHWLVDTHWCIYHWCIPRVIYHHQWCIIDLILGVFPYLTGHFRNRKIGPNVSGILSGTSRHGQTSGTNVHWKLQLNGSGNSHGPDWFTMLIVLPYSIIFPLIITNPSHPGTQMYSGTRLGPWVPHRNSVKTNSMNCATWQIPSMAGRRWSRGWKILGEGPRSGRSENHRKIMVESWENHM